ncbi:MAG: ATP phosphoribosyltransferase regulatory subunit [Nitrospirota bacterium]
MKNKKSIIPKGVAAFLPENVKMRRYIERSILDVFFQWGFQEIITPIFEYLDVISKGLEKGPADKGYKFVDRSSGRILLLRSDVTSQIARIAAMMLTEHPKPLRLCYSTNVFRYEEEHAGREREIFQLGCELIGSDGPEADAEMIIIAASSLKRLGLNNFKIAIGDVGFLRGLIEESALSLEAVKEIKEAIIKKDIQRLKMLLEMEDIGDDIKDSIMKVPDIFGREDIFDRAEDIANNKRCERALNRLKDVYNILKDYGLYDHILIDLGEIRGFDYYTDITFEIFTEEIGYELGGGGRYDNLLKRFGCDSTSTGFAFDLDRLQLSIEKIHGEIDFSEGDYLIIDLKKERKGILPLTSRLRESGYRVIEQYDFSNLESSIDFARKTRIKNILLLGEKGISKEKGVLINPKTGKTRIISLDKFSPHPNPLPSRERAG